MKRILIVEDDQDIAEIERDYLVANGFDAEIASTGPEGLELGSSGLFDLILLDIMLPGMDGFEVCRKLRSQVDVPIIMVTARHDDIDKIQGLGLGADGYIEKPFSPSVLVAFVKSHLNSYKRLSGAKSAPSSIVLGDIEVNTQSRRVKVRDQEVELTRREYDMLLYFMLHPDIVLSREALYENVWGMDAIGDLATIAVHVNRLREKIEVDPSNPRHIVTVWGSGYRFVP
ncbi:MAG: response regulator transcription factor [Coriobacteriales bacterium]